MWRYSIIARRGQRLYFFYLLLFSLAFAVLFDDSMLSTDHSHYTHFKLLLKIDHPPFAARCFKKKKCMLSLLLDKKKMVSVAI